MAAAESTEYEITWISKPLGFSIVMDTTGRNAYVSSIQKEENIEKGLKLAAQIVKIGETNVKQMQHSKILEFIRKEPLPMKLTFQPRSFAKETEDGQKRERKADNQLPEAFIIQGAPASLEQRVNGMFEKVNDDALREHNGRGVWQRRDGESDPILLWYWPKSVSGLNADLWMISRRTQLDKQGAYACLESDDVNPLNLHKYKWKVYNKNSQAFDETHITIANSVSKEQHTVDQTAEN